TAPGAGGVATASVSGASPAMAAVVTPALSRSRRDQFLLPIESPRDRRPAGPCAGRQIFPSPREIYMTGRTSTYQVGNSSIHFARKQGGGRKILKCPPDGSAIMGGSDGGHPWPCIPTTCTTCDPC